jgi:hypothetical protein
MLNKAISYVFICLVFAFLFGLWSMNGSHAYHDEATLYAESVQKILIQHKVCSDVEDCIKKHLLFQEGGAIKIFGYEFGGVNIMLYTISNAEIVGDVIKELGEQYKKLRGPKVHLYVYESAHRESEIIYANVFIK